MTDKMSAAQRLKEQLWLESDPLEMLITWTCGLIWCLAFWAGLAWWFDLLPDWSWL